MQVHASGTTDQVTEQCFPTQIKSCSEAEAPRAKTSPRLRRIYPSRIPTKELPELLFKGFFAGHYQVEARDGASTARHETGVRAEGPSQCTRGSKQCTIHLAGAASPADKEAALPTEPSTCSSSPEAGHERERCQAACTKRRRTVIGNLVDFERRISRVPFMQTARAASLPVHS
ncbi:hypothetical protein MRX96_013795 [Rhipicephalus microplus]